MNDRTQRAGLAVEINGEPRTVQAATLGALLEELGYRAEQAGVAVAVNEEVVRRGEWAERTLADGDRIEVVGAVQGG